MTQPVPPPGAACPHAACMATVPDCSATHEGGLTRCLMRLAAGAYARSLALDAFQLFVGNFRLT
eukprot:3004505-Pleurochrysis_carterae.AAC.2